MCPLLFAPCRPPCRQLTQTPAPSTPQRSPSTIPTAAHPSTILYTGSTAASVVQPKPSAPASQKSPASASTPASGSSAPASTRAFGIQSNNGFGSAGTSSVFGGGARAPSAFGSGSTSSGSGGLFQGVTASSTSSNGFGTRSAGLFENTTNPSTASAFGSTNQTPFALGSKPTAQNSGSGIGNSLFQLGNPRKD